MDIKNTRQAIKRAAIVIAAVAVAFGALVCRPAALNAAGLWKENSESLFSDRKAQYVGDIVTIIINESVSGTNKSNTTVTQKQGMESGTGTGLIGQFLQAFGIESSDSYQGGGTTTSNNTLVTRVSAEVVEVLPNGNLLVEARKSVVVNEETQMVVLSGVIRTKDINGDNSIDSYRIANAQIKYSGRGPIARRQHTGILNKIFDWIF